MHHQTESINTPANVATRFVKFENVSLTYARSLLVRNS